MAEERQPKWEGKASVEVADLTVKQVWSCLEDFCNLHKWFPNLDTCYQVEGVPGRPGLIRYCATTNAPSLPPDQSTDEKATKQWSKEKLLMIDPIQRCFSYEVLDNNIGFKSYVATIKVFAINGNEEEKGCMIEWSFVSDPIEGWRLDDLVSFVNYCLQYMAKKMEQAFLSNANQ